MFKISEDGIKLIKSFEGCSLKAYLCPAKVWTIGWGNTGNVNGKPIAAGMTITQKEADQLFLNSLKSYEEAVNKSVKVLINQHQYDALVSFTYNCGVGALKTSSLLDYLNNGEYEKAANEFLKWNKSKGKVLAGLTRRRIAEKSLFSTPMQLVDKDDTELFNATRALILKGYKLNLNSWKRLDLINLNNVGALIDKLGGLDHLAAKGIVSNRELWQNKKYSKENVRSLLIKASNML